ncbi:MAG: hypothetical protein KIS73_27395, partial [Enhydrobacter sp.]|nr:hypothetical protein [Enhydrobacter sp.]
MIRAVLAALLLLSATAAADDEPRIVEYASYEELLGLYAGLGYTMDAWRAGERAVPRVVLAHVPERWRGGVSDEIGTALKKELFFRVLAPLALIVNEAIAA